MFRFVHVVVVALFSASLISTSALAGDYYNKVPGLSSVTVGPQGTGATPANIVPGKEYSHNDWLAVLSAQGNPNVVSVGDHDAFAVPDPLQVVSWDGIAPIGRVSTNSGSVNAFDFNVPGFNFPSGQVDALANQHDALFPYVVNNLAALLFSMTGDLDASSVLPAAPVYKDHVHWEAPVGPGAGVGIGHGVWAGIEAPTIGTGVGPGVNHHVVTDLDALEVWGPEPPSHSNPANPTPVVEGYIGGFGNGPRTADSDRFSLDLDSGSGTAVWAYNTLSNSIAPWVPHSEIVAAIEKLFLAPGQRFDDEARRFIDIDALMARDLNNPSSTAPPLWNPGDELLFSIDPLAGNVLNAAGGPAGVVSIDGGEVMHLVKTGVGAGPANLSISFLKHGGHTWDTAFPVATTFGYFYEDLDALEAVGTLTGDREIPTPEPASAVLMVLGLAIVGYQRGTRA